MHIRFSSPICFANLKAEQRDGVEYEFTPVLDLTHDNITVATKDRSQLFLDLSQLGEHDGVLLKHMIE